MTEVQTLIVLMDDQYCCGAGAKLGEALTLTLYRLDLDEDATAELPRYYGAEMAAILTHRQELHVMPEADPDLEAVTGTVTRIRRMVADYAIDESLPMRAFRPVISSIAVADRDQMPGAKVVDEEPGESFDRHLMGYVIDFEVCAESPAVHAAPRPAHAVA